MNVGASIDVIRLNWVKDEIEASLREAGTALEGFVEDRDRDVALLKNCSARLHEVSGALRMLELSGPGILSLEMENMAASLARGDITESDSAIDALSRAILQLPDQLERLQSGEMDVPLGLLPMINELRTLRGEKPLEEFTLFKPDLTVFMPVQKREGHAAEAPESAEDAQQAAKRLRPIFQKSLVAWYRDPRALDHLQRLGAVLLRLSGVSQRYAAIQLWWVGSGLVQALGEGSLQQPDRAKQLLGQLDQQIKNLAESGEAPLADHPPERLVREMLYLLAHAESDAAQVNEIRETFQLEALFPKVDDARRAVGPNLELLRTVSDALLEDLAKAKDVLDIFVASNQTDPQELSPLIEGLGKISDILNMVNLESSRESVDAQVERVQAMIAGTTPCEHDQLMELAAVLLNVENTLNEMAQGHVSTQGDHADASASSDAQFEDALAGVVREAVSDMGLVKDAIVAFLANPQEKRVLEATPRYFERVSGCMQMLSHERAAKVAERIGDYVIEGLLNSETSPPREKLDLLADAITGLEYFVESTHQQRPNALQQLEMAAERLRDLGFPVEQSSAFEEYSAGLDIDLDSQMAETRVGGGTEEPAPDAVADEETGVDIDLALVVGDDDEVSEVSEHLELIEPESEPEIDSTGDAAAAEEPVTETVDESVGEEDPSLAETAVAAEPQPTPETGAEPAISDESDLPPVLAEDSDPETVEIFVEEAEEIRDAVKADYARWRENQGNEEALTELRRSFHTLKGSGRLVGALRIGEMAWAIENTLNRVIDKSVSTSNAMFDLLDQVVALIPRQVEELQGGAPVPADEVAAVIEGAEFLSLSPERQEAELAELARSARAPKTDEPGEIRAPAEPVAETVPEGGDEETSQTAETADEEILPVEANVSPEEAAEEDTGAMDPVLYEIFSQETESHIAAIEQFIEGCRNQGDHCPVNDQLLRALHTLHGSARMAGVISIADVSGALERYAKLLHKSHGEFAPETLDILPAAVKAIGEVFEHLNDVSKPLPDTETLVERIESLEAQEQSAQIQRIESDADTLMGSDAANEAQEARDRIAIFLEEAADTLDSLENTVHQWGEVPQEQSLLTELRRSLHTFKGGARTIGLDEVGDLVHAVEALLKSDDGEAIDDTATIDLTQRCIDRLAEMLNQVAQVGSLTMPDDLIEEIEALLELRSATPATEAPPADSAELESTDLDAGEASAGGADEAAPEINVDLTPTMAFDRDELEAAWSESLGHDTGTVHVDDDAMGELVDIFLEEAEEILDNTENTLEHWNNNPANHSLVGELERQLHTLKGGARMAEITPVADLSHSMETLLKAVVDGKVEVSRDLFDVLHQSVDSLVGMIEKLRHGSALVAATPLIEALESIATGRDQEPKNSAVMEIPPELQEKLAETAVDLGQGAETGAEVGDTLVGDAMSEAPAQVEEVPEADVGESAAAEAESAAPVDEPEEVAESALEPEPEPESNAETAPPMAESPLADAVPEPEPATTELESFTSEVDSEPMQPAATQVSASPADEVSAGLVDESDDERRQAPRVQHETIRVRADLIDDLVNYAGEVGIYRSRLEQQSLTFRTNLSELEQTVSRLNQQLRNLEIETEAQILYRYEKEGEASKEEFDPLELDRFSTMQQLSRALAESVNDLDNLREMLGNLNRESETLLLQQSRVANTLQEGLMRSRMVQFGGLMPRMRRIVRQACQELGKWAKLRVEGAGVEMDTTVIDRMLPALEHILRNAVAHGIEAPEVRRSQGKEETGIIGLDLSRDGPDVVINITDNGAGIDVEAIRAKAIERGMLRADAKLKNEDLVQLILESGMSTAAQVTQLAGRGVGMDVVVSEIKQLGGSMQIETERGKGTRFTLRLPFTLAVNRALLVQAGEDLYAIPLANVVGIARISDEELNQFQEGRVTDYEYAGGRYTYRHLGALLGGKVLPPQAGETRIPLLMVRSGENFTALHADAVLGSRDVVVKSLGRQMSSVRGLLGATILADGRVVLILDVSALVHRGVVMEAAETAEEEQVDRGSGPPRVMVVDDSITIRKVTSRLLERHDMRAITAKDGVDALAVMQDTIPDVMLLDIEMPRMDGYDLAAHMRADDRLKSIPIVMITSRTGDKHRQRAIDLGVDRYLGKPYQEAELVQTINEMLEKSKATTRH